MSGHNKWAQIKRQKGAEDAKKSKIFGKYGSLIANEVKKQKGDVNAASVRALIEKAKKENMPKDTIDRALKKGQSSDMEEAEELVYEAYGPGGCAMIIVAFSSNRNKAAQEVKHILSKNNISLASAGSAAWAFTRNPDGEYVPNSTMDLSDDDLQALSKVVDELEANEEVQDVYTNVE
jgi:transcriptional/translational regulatory protein YebC/TACO1